MKEYSGKSAKVYELSNRKELCLVPAVERHLPKAKGRRRLLDVGCGNGAFYPQIAEKGYEYFGLDYSPDMVAIAKAAHPKGAYAVGSATGLSKIFKFKFDAIAAMLLLNVIQEYRDVEKILKECKKALKPRGILILGLPHPTFDKYMQAGMLGEKNVEAKFEGYFTRAKYAFRKEFSKGDFTFTQRHYTLADYFNAVHNAGFQIEAMDECPPDRKLKTTKSKLYEKYSVFPGYLVWICQRQ